jgi:hypothetical protein
MKRISVTILLLTTLATAKAKLPVTLKAIKGKDRFVIVQPFVASTFVAEQTEGAKVLDSQVVQCEEKLEDLGMVEVKGERYMAVQTVLVCEGGRRLVVKGFRIGGN